MMACLRYGFKIGNLPAPARACVFCGKTSETTKSPMVNSISTDNGDKSCDRIQLLCAARALYYEILPVRRKHRTCQ